MNTAPRPVPDADTAPFWEAAADHRLVVPRCAACRRWIWQPRPVCPHCHTPDPAWEAVTGEGNVVSWTVVHPPVLPVWVDEAPFTLLLVELDVGVRMVGRLVDGEPDELEHGTPVTLRWRHDAVALPAWTIRTH